MMTTNDRPTLLRRLFARMVDGILFLILGVGVSLLVKANVVWVVFAVGLFLTLFVYGQSVGDRLFKMKLVSTDETQPVTAWRILVRVMLLPVGLLHMVTVLDVTERRQLLHDQIAKTEMIVTSK
ncbi:RDD family protein [Brevibacillus dissolubilis]|uniref:RDD family protein n=1 Tax=Brevibacillus dissolubilis TaxID=1844116 RepID=UPI0011178B31|nr:RDD family protein [Brevibacillus dissolubilis]